METRRVFGSRLCTSHWWRDWIKSLPQQNSEPKSRNSATNLRTEMQKSEFDSSMSMQPEFVEQHSSSPANDQMFQAITTMMMQVNHTNQTLMNWLTNQSQLTTKLEKQKDSRIHPPSFSGLPTEDILAWLDHFENVAGYHEWDDGRKALELRTVLEHVAATWFIQQPEEIKRDWPYLREQLVQQFANNDVTQTTLQQLDTL